MPEISGTPGPDESDDDPQIAPPPGARGPKKDPGPLLGSRGSHPTPAHPYGRCEDCGGFLEPGLEGTYCGLCDVAGPHYLRYGRQVRARRVPDMRRSREALRVNQHQVWMLAGARS